MNLYNDLDPKVCEWTRELIADNQIPAGEVVCQSITDITHDLSKFTQCHWFNGLSGWPYALRLAGVSELRPLWTASLPCQSFSSAGKAGGFADARGQLWEPFFALVRKYRPGCIFGEQVEAAIRFGWLDRIFSDLEGIGYSCGAVVLPAACVGAPHIRHRIYWVAHLPGERRDGQQEAGGQTGRGQFEVGGGDERLAHTECTQRRPQFTRDERDRDEGRSEAAGRPESCCPDERLADMQGQRPSRRGERPIQSEPSSCGNAGWMEHSQSRRARAEEQPGCRDGLERPMSDGGVVQSDGTGREPGRLTTEAAGYRDSIEPTGGGCGLGDPKGGGQREHGSTPGSGGYADEPKQIGGMGDLHHQRPQGRSGEPGECAGKLFAGASGPWSNYDLIPCRDGKFRRVESGSCPLVKRLPGGLVPSGNPSVEEAQNTAEARVMRLRGYGNSICAPLAAEFIKVCMELLPKFTPPPI